MQIITRDMHMEAIRSLTESNPAIADDVVARDDEVDKLFWMIEKQHHQVLRDVYFAEKLNVTPQEALGFLLVARSIERVADHAVKLANNGRSVRPGHRLVPKLSEMSKAVIDLFDDATNTFNKNNFDNAYDIINRSELLGIKIEKLKHDTLLLVDEQSTTVAIAYIMNPWTGPGYIQKTSLRQQSTTILHKTILSRSIGRYFRKKNQGIWSGRILVDEGIKIISGDFFFGCLEIVHWTITQLVSKIGTIGPSGVKCKSAR